MDCYCLQEFKSSGPIVIKDKTFDGGEKPCVDWLASYSITNAILIGLSLSISILNAVLRVCLRELSQLEGKHSETDRLASATTKMWLVQFVNVGILILLLNSRFP